MPHRSWLPVWVLPLTLLLSACSTFDHADGGLADRAEADRSEVAAWPALSEAENAGSLDALIPSDNLAALVHEALVANPGLRQTWLTLRTRQAELRQTTGDRWPGLEAGLSGSRDENAAAGYTGSVSIDWEVDLWGKLADEQAAAMADVAEERGLYQSARDTLAGEVMSAWVGLIAQRRAVAIQSRRLETLKTNQALIIDQYRAGLGSLEDLDTARSNVASARATLEEQRETLAQRRRSLAEMLGRSSAERIAVPDDFPETLLVRPELPEQTLARRPDLQAAYAAIEAAERRTDVAYKDLLPSLDVTAALEDVAETPHEALLGDPLWSLLGQLTAPLFQGGRLKAAADIAELEAAQAYQAYRETLLEAVGEVQDAIGLETSLARRQADTAEALASARRSLGQYTERYRAGLVDLVDLLDVQQQTYDLEASRNDLIESRLTNRIDLGLALGLGVNE